MCILSPAVGWLGEMAKRSDGRAALRCHVLGGVIDDPEARHARAFGLDMAPSAFGLGMALRNRRTFWETALA